VFADAAAVMVLVGGWDRAGLPEREREEGRSKRLEKGGKGRRVRHYRLVMRRIDRFGSSKFPL